MPATRRWPGVWRGGSLRHSLPTLPSGHEALDRHLPGGGWPLGALTELLMALPGSGEFGLLLPALAGLTAQGRWVVLVDPPWVPYPPALRGHGIDLERLLLLRTGNAQESLWSCEQVMRGIRGGAVLAWQADPGFARLRRLQLAARSGGQAAFLFRPLQVAAQATPAALRLRIGAEAGRGRVEVLKCQGRRPEKPLMVNPAPGFPGLRIDPPVDDRLSEPRHRPPEPGDLRPAGVPAH